MVRAVSIVDPGPQLNTVPAQFVSEGSASERPRSFLFMLVTGCGVAALAFTKWHSRNVTPNFQTRRNRC